MKKWLSIVLVLALCISVNPIIKFDLKASGEGSLIGDIGQAVTDATSDVAKDVKEAAELYYDFGSYPLWNDEREEYVSSPLKWRVIHEDDNCYTLMIDRVLFESTFGDGDTVSWKESKVRSFLNDELYNQAFNDSMKQDILNTEVQYKGFDKSVLDVLSDTWGEPDDREQAISKGDYFIEGSTIDKVYILSAEEYMNPDYGFKNTREKDVSRVFYYDPVAFAPEDPSDYPTLQQIDWDRDEETEYNYFIRNNNYGAVWVWTRDIEGYPAMFDGLTPTAVTPHGALNSSSPLWKDTQNLERNYQKTCPGGSAGIQPVIRVKKGSKYLKRTSAPQKPDVPKSFIEYYDGSNNDNNPGQSDSANTSGKSIQVYPNNKHIYMLKGSKIHLGFELLINGQPAHPWTKTVSYTNSDVVTVMEVSKDGHPYNLQITASKPGTSYLTVSDADSGVSTTLEIIVEDLSDTKTYPIRSTFLSKNSINGVVFDNYSFDYDDKTKNYMVHLNAYNYNYYNGSVDVFDKNGKWIGSNEIKKFAIPSHLYEVKDEILFLADDSINGKKGSYKSGNETKKTTLEFKVPQGGYFTISNNYSESTGTLIYNTIDLVFDLISHLKRLFKGPSDTSDSKKETLKKRYIEKFLQNASKEDKKAMVKLIKTVIKKATKASLSKQELYEVYTGINSEFINSCNAIGFDLKDELLKTVFNAVEDVLDFLGGGLLKSGFEIFDFINLETCVYQIGNSINCPVYTFYTDEYKNNSMGITVTQNNNPIPNTKVQAFRVYDDSSMKQYFSNSELIENSELYQINLIKDDQIVQPDSKVTVRIPIPSGMNKKNCSVYREESDGQWTKLNVTISNDQYLVFETDHFSLYAIVGEPDNLRVKSLPLKLDYTVNEWLDTTGLELYIDDNVITDGYYCSPVFFSDAGDYVINVLYGSAQTSFSVHVSKSGFIRDTDNVIKYYDNGKILTNLTDVKHDPNTNNWYNIVNGVVTPGPTIAKNSYGWWYIDNDGKVDFTAQSIYQNQHGWWKTTNGKVTFKENGIFQNDYGWWRVKDSKVDFKAQGIYQNQYGWWKTTDGKVTFKENGVFQNENGWWKVKDSKVDFNFTGIARNKYGSWYIKTGKVDFSKNGKVKYNNKTYTIKNGKVV